MVIFDSLENSKIETLSRIKQVLSLEGKYNFDVEKEDDRLMFFQVDLRDLNKMSEIIDTDFNAAATTTAKDSNDRIKKRISSIIHFAGLKFVNESVKDPIRYYDYNFLSSLNLLKLVQQYQMNHFIFSSSATIYGDITQLPGEGEEGEDYLPLRENQLTKIPINPYGNTKLLIEKLLQDYSKAQSSFQVGILRYFNPIGAHPSHLIGEDPLNEPLNLLPIIANYTVFPNKTLKVYGDDYNTKDGTCIRDYIHIEDLARGHVLALSKLELNSDQPGNNYNEWNLGTGIGYSVLDIITQWQKSTGIEVKYEIVPRREGDVKILVASVRKSLIELGFKCESGLKEACRDLWGWTKNYYGASMSSSFSKDQKI